MSKAQKSENACPHKCAQDGMCLEKKSQAYNCAETRQRNDRQAMVCVYQTLHTMCSFAMHVHTNSRCPSRIPLHESSSTLWAWYTCNTLRYSARLYVRKLVKPRETPRNRCDTTVMLPRNQRETGAKPRETSAKPRDITRETGAKPRDISAKPARNRAKPPRNHRETIRFARGRPATLDIRHASPRLWTGFSASTAWWAWRTRPDLGLPSRTGPEDARERRTGQSREGLPTHRERARGWSRL